MVLLVVVALVVEHTRPRPGVFSFLRVGLSFRVYFVLSVASSDTTKKVLGKLKLTMEIFTLCSRFSFSVSKRMEAEYQKHLLHEGEKNAKKKKKLWS